MKVSTKGRYGLRAMMDLAAHQGDHLRRRTDEGEPRLATRRREGAVLGEEPVARVDGIRLRATGDVEQPVDAQVAVGGRVRPERVCLIGVADVQRRAIALGVHGDRLEPHLAARADDANRDFAPVGNENLANQV